MRVCVLASSQTYELKAKAIAVDLNLPFLPEEIDVKDWRKEVKRLSSLLVDFQAALVLEDKGISLLPVDIGQQRMSPIYIDFTNETWKRRLFNISSKTELAAKALGLNKKENSRVFDANAGLGQDSFVFAALGANVLAFERSPLVYCLLSDALHRAKQDVHVSKIAERITLVQEDAILQMSTANVEIIGSIYLDPMFPEKKHQALAKKEMQVFQQIIGADKDAELLVKVALDYLFSNKICTRVVIKRPRLAPVLFPEKLGRQIDGNSTRFDIYYRS